jgi:hypothetical protein
MPMRMARHRLPLRGRPAVPRGRAGSRHSSLVARNACRSRCEPLVSSHAAPVRVGIVCATRCVPRKARATYHCNGQCARTEGSCSVALSLQRVTSLDPRARRPPSLAKLALADLEQSIARVERTTLIRLRWSAVRGSVRA